MTTKKPTIWTQYAKNYNVSLTKAIADRDEPMNEQECIDAFVESSGGRYPSDLEVREMHPDSEQTIQRQVDYYNEQENR